MCCTCSWPSGGLQRSPVLPLQTVPKEAALRAVSFNLGAGLSWKHLETPEPEQQGLQAAAHSVKNALVAMYQRIQESCQSGTKWLVETPKPGWGRHRVVAPPSSLPEPEEHPAFWNRPIPLNFGPLGVGAAPQLHPDGPTCPPTAEVQEGGRLLDPLLLYRAPLLPQ